MFEHLTKDVATAAAFTDPQPGDSFHEMYSFRMFVVAVETDGRVAVLEASPPCTLPHDGKLKIYTSHNAYRSHYAYGSIPGYWMRIAERGMDVTGWFKGWPEPVSIADCSRCASLLSVATEAKPTEGGS